MVQIGVFIPIGSRGWLRSTTSPRLDPTFDLNRAIVQRAEHYGLDFALAMVKLRGFDGPSEFWQHNLEPFTLMAGLAAVTQRIKLYASIALLTLPPPLAARMVSTIDSIAPGRFGVNIVTGWQPKEYQQMGLWPGNEHFKNRYDYATEYVRVMKELWETGTSDFKGRYFQMDDCKLSPRPSAHIDIVAAGTSDRGMEFVAEHCDYNFVSSGGGINEADKAGRMLPASPALLKRPAARYLPIPVAWSLPIAPMNWPGPSGSITARARTLRPLSGPTASPAPTRVPPATPRRAAWRPTRWPCSKIRSSPSLTAACG